MSMSDPLGDMLTRIRNAQRARHSSCVAPASRLRANVLDVLKREGFIRGFAAEQLRPGVAQLLGGETTDEALALQHVQHVGAQRRGGCHAGAVARALRVADAGQHIA